MGMDFIIDAVGESQNADTSTDNIANTPDSSIVKDLFAEFKTLLKTNESGSKVKNVKNNEDLMTKQLLEELGWNRKHLPLSQQKTKQKTKTEHVAVDKEIIKKVLQKSVITPQFEQLNAVPPFDVADKKLRAERRKEREKTKGKKWFGLPATEMNEEIKRDLEILQMRSVLDPKHFYKKNDLKVLPKYFQVGKVIDSPLEFYNNRLTKKERKKTLVDELLADAEFNKYNKRKYKEIIAEKQKTHYKAWRQAKRLKKKK